MPHYLIFLRKPSLNRWNSIVRGQLPNMISFKAFTTTKIAYFSNPHKIESHMTQSEHLLKEKRKKSAFLLNFKL